MADAPAESEFRGHLVDAIRAHVRPPDCQTAEALADALSQTLTGMDMVVIDAEELHLERERGNHYAEQLRAAEAERDRLAVLVADYENGISWETSCIGCAKLLDQMRQQEERAERAEARIAAASSRHAPTTVTELVLCRAHMDRARVRAVARGEADDCAHCTTRPARACSNITCCNFPCAVHLDLHGETEETCIHQGTHTPPCDDPACDPCYRDVLDEELGKGYYGRKGDVR